MDNYVRGLAESGLPRYLHCNKAYIRECLRAISSNALRIQRISLGDSSQSFEALAAASRLCNDLVRFSSSILLIHVLTPLSRCISSSLLVI